MSTKTATITLKTADNTYDIMGNLLTTVSGEDVSSYIYDKAGRTLLANENGKCTRTLYDNLGRTVQEISPEDYDITKDGLPESNTYADAKAGHRYVYAANGTLTSETNRLGKTTAYYYNDIGSKIREEFDIYKFYYLNHGEIYQIKVANTVTVAYNYDNEFKLLSETYANDEAIRYTYNENGDLSAQYHNSNANPYITYTYNAEGKLTQKINTDTGLKYVYGENSSVSVYRISDNALVQSYTEVQTEADEEKNISAKTDITETHFNKSYSSVIKDKSVVYSTGLSTTEYSYLTEGKDGDEKVASDTVKFNGNAILSSAYSYDGNSNVTDKTITLNGKNVSFINTYDSKDRITSHSFNGNTISYTYDDDGQLTGASGTGYSSNYSYDARGNITSKTVNDLVTSFTYANFGWKDLLVAVDGVELTYDEIGNVLTFGDRTFTWNSGRNLASITDGSNTYSYKYDENGIRTSKTVNGVTTNYNTRKGVILSQSDGTNTFYFQYDNSGTPFGFILNGIQYFYLKNQMGDVIAITESNGNAICEYFYDEWGNLLNIYIADENNTAQVTAANANPLRYRGYYYDTETGYYYLLSRYYDPSICRFINADISEIAQMAKEVAVGINLFAYCNNDPINFVDFFGLWAQKYSGFSWTSTGFNLYVQLSFLSRPFCMSYAKDIISLRGKWYWWGKGYKNMSAVRIAQELWFHALVYYVGSPIKSVLNKLGVSWSWLNSKLESAKYMEINNNDNRAWVFSLVWWAAYSVKTLIRLSRGYMFPYAYIHI